MKVSIVLVLPAVVALGLAGTRIRAEIMRADTLSALRDQLPVVRGIAELADLLSREAGESGAGSKVVAAQVDSKSSGIATEADFAKMNPDARQHLKVTLLQLKEFRGRQARTQDIAIDTWRYHGLVFALSGIIPETVSVAGDDGLNSTANAVAALFRLRSGLAREQIQLRSATQALRTDAALVTASQLATETVVLGDEVARVIPPGIASRFAVANSSAAKRRTAVEEALTGERAAGLSNMIGPIGSDFSALGGIVSELVDSLSSTVEARTSQARSDALRDAALVLGALLGALVVALYVARSLVMPMKQLHSAALEVAHRRLPNALDRVLSGETVDWRSVEPMSLSTGEEIGQLARAFEEVHRQAIRLAGQQAKLRAQVTEMFVTLSRRSQSLVDKQLSVIEELEADERDPHRLALLFRIDHIAARLRRNGENLQVLAGANPARHDRAPVSAAELMRAAASEVKDYRRIAFGNAPSALVLALPAADVVHILAEMIENATRFSPPDKKVLLTAERTAHGGLLMEVVDSGLGMAPEDIAAANERLATMHFAGPETVRRMGLFVVGRLAAPLGVTVRLRRNPGPSGITASIYLPAELVVTDAVPSSPELSAVQGKTQQASTAASTGAAIRQRDESAIQDTQPMTSVRDIYTPAKIPVFAPAASERLENDRGRHTSTTGWADWFMPTDEPARAARSTVEPSNNAAVTKAGLPVREPGAQLATGAAPAPQVSAETTIESRDPTAIRRSLVRHSQGLRAARAHVADPASISESPAQE
ncbi:sensor histidine kinase [Amycolatopsis sp. NPDC058986]|uniref:sensor histidine kinase n=1 Tax=unclassified Amycolatopsis TaxID=2618356 RepID=UPI00367347D5